MKIIKEVISGRILDKQDMNYLKGGAASNINDAIDCTCAGSTNSRIGCNDNNNKMDRCQCNGNQDNSNSAVDCKCGF